MLIKNRPFLNRAPRPEPLEILLRELGNQSLQLESGRVRAREALSRVLHKRDLPGPAVMARLARLVEDPRLEHGMRRRLATELLTHLSEPHRLFHQLNHKGTCAATAPAYCFLRDNPLEFVNLVCDLCQEGRARMPDGQAVSLPFRMQGSVPPTGNTLVETVVQCAFMSFATEGRYDPHTDQVREGASLHRGLRSNEMARLMSALYRQPYRVWQSPPGGTHPEQLRRPLTALRPGAAPVLGGMIWPGEGRHAVSLTGVRQDQVYFRNPWGRPHSLRLSSSHQVLRNGTERMPSREFIQSLDFLVYPRGTMPDPGPPAPPSMPVQMAEPDRFWTVGGQRYPDLESACPRVQRSEPVRLYRQGDPLPLYKLAGHTVMGLALGAVVTSLAGVMLGAPAGPVVQALGAVAVGALAYSNARSMSNPVELERGRLTRRGEQVFYQPKSDGLIPWNAGPARPVG